METLPAEELPVGIPGEAQPLGPGDRDEGGRFLPGNALARAGGRAKAGKTKLAHRLGLKSLPEDSDFAQYKASAITFRRATCVAIASSVGGGHCGPIPSSMVASASLALAWSRYLSDMASTTGDADLAAKSMRHAEISSSLLRQAHEYAAKEAVARQQHGDPMEELRTRIAGANSPSLESSNGRDIRDTDEPGLDAVE